MWKYVVVASITIVAVIIVIITLIIIIMIIMKLMHDSRIMHYALAWLVCTLCLVSDYIPASRMAPEVYIILYCNPSFVIDSLLDLSFSSSAFLFLFMNK